MFLWGQGEQKKLVRSFIVSIITFYGQLIQSYSLWCSLTGLPKSDHLRDPTYLRLDTYQVLILLKLIFSSLTSSQNTIEDLLYISRMHDKISGNQKDITCMTFYTFSFIFIIQNICSLQQFFCEILWTMISFFDFQGQWLYK